MILVVAWIALFSNCYVPCVNGTITKPLEHRLAVSIGGMYYNAIETPTCKRRQKCWKLQGWHHTTKVSGKLMLDYREIGLVPFIYNVLACKAGGGHTTNLTGCDTLSLREKCAIFRSSQESLTSYQSANSLRPANLVIFFH